MKSDNGLTDDLPNTNAQPLDQVHPGSTVRIVEIDSGHTLKNRLAAMGLPQGHARHRYSQ